MPLVDELYAFGVDANEKGVLAIEDVQALVVDLAVCGKNCGRCSVPDRVFRGVVRREGECEAKDLLSELERQLKQ